MKQEPTSSSASERFHRGPEDVLGDKRLNDRDYRVYSGLALHAIGSEKVTVGLRWLAGSCTVPVNKLGKSLKKLAKLGLITIKPAAHGKRQSYELAHPIFLAKPETRGAVTAKGKPRMSRVVLQARQWAKLNNDSERIA